MYFKHLKDNIKEALKDLPKDAEFQKRFSEDPVLDSLDAEKFDPAKVYPDLLSFCGFRRPFAKTALKPITPLMWAFLWAVDNPIVKTSKKEVKQTDVDLFFYLLENGVTDTPLTDLITRSIGYCASIGLSEEVQVNAVNILISEAFGPLKMFPSQPKTQLVGEEGPVFDVDWLSSMICKVHQATGHSPEYIMKSMSMTAVCYFYVQWCKDQGAKGIDRRTSREIIEAQDRRASELVVDRLIEKGVVKPEERAAIIEEMTTYPEPDEEKK